jgi:hypothetical protein
MFEKPLIGDIQKVLKDIERLGNSHVYSDPEVMAALQDMHKNVSKAGLAIITHLMEQPPTSGAKIRPKGKHDARPPECP